MNEGGPDDAMVITVACRTQVRKARGPEAPRAGSRSRQGVGGRARNDEGTKCMIARQAEPVACRA